MTADSSIHVALSDGPIDVAAYQDALANPDTGSHVWFHGVTRRTTGDKITQTLFYEAKASMATNELQRVARVASERFHLMAVVIVHRLGEVPIGDSSIVVGCSSAHRADTFAAVTWIMDEVKRNVPIWKRETFVGGDTLWIHPETST